MHFENISKINKGILKNKKVIITLGCSFVEAQGAIDQSIWDLYKPGTPHNPNGWGFTKEQQEQILSEFPDVYLDPNHIGQLNFTFHEINRSFGHVLCEKYFNDEYTCINLGRRGNGNKSSIKDLYFYPDILWDKIEEIIVIYCPTGAERHDFIDDQYGTVNHHGRWVTIWPGSQKEKPPYTEKSSPQDILSCGLDRAVYSTKFEILEQISHIQELMLWCKYKNAKLIITPAFMTYYNKKQFNLSLNMETTRDKDRRIIHQKPGVIENDEIEKIVNMWPWENMFHPNNEPTFADLAMSQEKSVDRSLVWFYNFEYKGTPDKWITPCAHPSAKAHDLFAQCLYKHIVG